MFMSKNDDISGRTFWILLAGIFLISFSLLTFEISLSRVLSVLLSYHYVFLSVSLALLGLGLGGFFAHFLKSKETRGNSRFRLLTWFASLFSLAIPFSTMLIVWIGSVRNIQGKILIYCLLLFVPFFFAGIVLAWAFRVFPSLSAWIYGADLIGAAVASFCAILALDIFGGVDTSFALGGLTSIAALIFAMKVAKENIRSVLIPAIVFLIVWALFGANVAGLYSPDIPIGINSEKEIHDVLYAPSIQGKIIDTKWSAFGRTDLVQFDLYPDLMQIYVDGTAGSPMYRFNGNIDEPDFAISELKTTFSGYFPFIFLKEAEKDNALIIGPGGGRDILLAGMGGVREVTAVEVNKDLADLVHKYSEYNGSIYSDLDNMRLVIDEGRNYLKRQKEKYDIIMLSLPNTNTSRSLEGFALTENFLFTKESILDYLDHLTEEGRIIVVCHGDIEISRMFSISLAALEKRGVLHKTAMKHIYMVGSDRYPVFVLKKNPFDKPEVLLRYKALNQFGVDPASSYFPYIRTEETRKSVLTGLGNGKLSLEEFVSKIKDLGYDISPVTDNSPFFYKFEVGLPSSLYVVFWSSLALMLFVMSVPPLLWIRKPSWKKLSLKDNQDRKQNLLKSIILFSILGIGFMLVEISLIQRFVFFLGRPVLSLAIILFSLLLGAGAGSMTSNRFVSDKIAKWIAIASVSIFSFLLAYAFLLPLIFKSLLGFGLTIRLLASISLLTPLGFFMGFPFPLGIRFLKEKGMESYIPWMWGINGIGSVLGSVITVMIAIIYGITEALIVGASCYFLVFLLFGIFPKFRD